MSNTYQTTWQPGTAPIAVVMITLNEGHNMEAVLENLKGWAQEVFIVDSYSTDDTIDIALKYGVHVVQRRFRGFGDQWNFAISQLPITAPWTMKLDPDERLTTHLSSEIIQATMSDNYDAFNLDIQLFFMSKPLSVKLSLTRIWKTGTVKFSDVLANEHAISSGKIGSLKGFLEHHDSPHLHHWIEKQNKYTTSEAITSFLELVLSDKAKLFGSKFQRRMWLKKNYTRIPFRYNLIFLHCFFIAGAWRAGRVGIIWSRLRSDVYRIWEYKVFEMKLTGKKPTLVKTSSGVPDPRVPQYD